MTFPVKRIYYVLFVFPQLFPVPLKFFLFISDASKDPLSNELDEQLNVYDFVHFGL